MHTNLITTFSYLLKHNPTTPPLNIFHPIQCSISNNLKIHRCQHQLLDIRPILQRFNRTETSSNFTWFWKWDTGFNFQNLGCSWSPFYAHSQNRLEASLATESNSEVCTHQTPKTQPLQWTRRLHNPNKAVGSITCTQHIHRAALGLLLQDSRIPHGVNTIHLTS